MHLYLDSVCHEPIFPGVYQVFLADWVFSGVSLPAWRSDFQQNWIELYSSTWCCWVPDLFVGFSMFGETSFFGQLLMTDMYRAGLYTNNRYVWDPVNSILNWASADDTIIGKQLARLGRGRSLWHFVCLYF
jgi:hypothetical protein